MKNTKIKTAFSDIISLVQSSSTQDIMLINETSPSMVRFLCKDNIFRTFQLFEEGESTKIETTNVRDPESSLEDFKVFVKERSKESTDDAKLQAQKKADQVKRKKQAEEAHKLAVAKKLKSDAEAAKKENAQTLAPAPEAKVTKKKATKKKATKKKATKKKATKKKAAKKKK